MLDKQDEARVQPRPTTKCSLRPLEVEGTVDHT